MKSFAAFTVAVLALASQASAQVLSYSHPISADRWTAGSTATVSWSNACTEVTGVKSFPIILNHQVGQFQVPYPGIPELGNLDCTAAGSVTVNVPMVPQGSSYSILVTNGGTQSYSALFTIISTIAGDSNSTVSATVSGTASATASVTGSVSVTLTPTASASVTSAASSASTLATITTGTRTTTAVTPTRTNQAGIVKTGSTAALVIVAAIASLML